jgi:hypothetical protein
MSPDTYLQAAQGVHEDISSTPKSNRSINNELSVLHASAALATAGFLQEIRDLLKEKL